MEILFSLEIPQRSTESVNRYQNPAWWYRSYLTCGHRKNQRAAMMVQEMPQKTEATKWWESSKAEYFGNFHSDFSVYSRFNSCIRCIFHSNRYCGKRSSKTCKSESFQVLLHTMFPDFIRSLISTFFWWSIMNYGTMSLSVYIQAFPLVASIDCCWSSAASSSWRWNYAPLHLLSN